MSSKSLRLASSWVAKRSWWVSSCSSELKKLSIAAGHQANAAILIAFAAPDVRLWLKAGIIPDQQQESRMTSMGSAGLIAMAALLASAGSQAQTIRPFLDFKTA